MEVVGFFSQFFATFVTNQNILDSLTTQPTIVE